MKNVFLTSCLLVFALGFIAESWGDDIPLPPPMLSANPLNFEADLQAGEEIVLQSLISNIGDVPVNWQSEVRLAEVGNRDRVNRECRSIINDQHGPRRDERGEVLAQHQVPYRYVCGMVWDGEYLWGTSYRQDRLFAINTENEEVVYDFRTCNDPRGLAFDGDNLYVNRGEEGRSRIFIYNHDGDLIDYFDLPYQIQGMTIDDAGRLLVNDFETQRIHIVDIETHDELFVVDILNSLELENYSIGALLWIEEHRPGQLWFAARDNSSNECSAFQISIDADWHTEEIQHFPFEEESFYAIAHDGQNLWHSGRYEQQSWWVYDDGIVEAKLVTVEPESGLLDVNEEVNISININTHNQFAGVYPGFLEISAENPEVPVLPIGFNVIIEGVPEMEISWEVGQNENLLSWNDHFETIYVNEVYSLPIIFRNTGSTQLNIENVDINSEFFLPSHRNLILPPRTWQQVTLDFFTPQSGVYLGLLSVRSDDPDQRELEINIVADVQTPPTAVVEPVNIIEVLPIGILSETAVNISNEGEDVLNWKVEFEDAQIQQRDRPDIHESGPKRHVRNLELETNPFSPNPDFPNRDFPGEILNQFNIPYRDVRGLAFDGEHLWGIAWNEGRLFEIHPQTGELHSNIEIHDMPRALTWDGVNFLIGDVNRRVIYVYNRQGDMLDNFDLGLEYDGLASNQHNYLYVNCRTDNKIHVFDSARRVEIGIVEYSDLIVDDDIDCIEWVPNHFNGKLWCLSRNHVYQLDVNENWQVELVNGFDWNVDQKYAGLTHNGENLWHGMRGERRLYEHDDGVREVLWAEAQPDSGSLLGFMDEDLFITLNANDDIGGVLNATMHVLTNDPVNRDILIPISLQVIGVPGVSIAWEFGADDNRIDWSDYPLELFSNGSYSVPVSITNPGDDLLIIEEIISNNRAFEASPEQLTILPGETDICDFVFSPIEIGIHIAEMVVHSNVVGAEEISIDLIAESLPPPVIQVDQRRIEDEIQIRDNSNQIVTISNNGESTLIWRTWLEYPDVQFRENPQADERDDIDLDGRNRRFLSGKSKVPVRDNPGDILQQYDIPYSNTSGLAWDGFLMWGVDDTENHLFAIDLNTELLISDFVINAQPNGLAFDGTDFLVGGGRDIYKYDLNGQLLDQYRPNVRPDAIACGEGRFLFILDDPNSIIHVLRMEDFEEVCAIDCGDIFGDISLQSIEWVDLHFEGQLWCVSENRIWQLYIDENWHPVIVNEFETINDQNYTGIAHNGTNIIHGISEQRIWIECDDAIDETPLITVVNDAGRLESEEETEIQINFDADRYMGGSYSGILHILSNAPDNPDEIVEIQLTILGNPAVATNPIAHPFEGNVPIVFESSISNEGQSSQDIVIKNVGTDNLQILGIESDSEEFRAIIPQDLSIAIRDSIEIEFIFTPLQAGQRQCRISIITNAENIDDGTLRYDLLGNGVTHPIASTTYDENSPIDVQIQMFERDISRELVIRNAGDENSVDLEFSILPLSVDMDNQRDLSPQLSPRRSMRSILSNEEFPSRDFPVDILEEMGIPYLGTKDLAWDGELIWGIVSESGRLIAVNPIDANVVSNFRTSSNAHCMAFNGLHFYIGIDPDNTIIKCDRNGNIINTFEMPFGDIRGLSFDDYGNLLIAAGRESVVHVLNINNFNEVSSFQLNDILNGSLRSIVWVSDHPNGQLWTVSRDRIYQVYLDRDWNPELVGEISADQDMQLSGITHDGINLWLGLNNTESWLSIDDGVSEISIETWIQISPQRGVLSQESESEILFEFSAENLEPSTEYQCEILIRTNDPDTPEISIPASMTTESVPVHFNNVHETFAFHNIQISEMLLNGQPMPGGFEIGTFTPGDILAGAIVWSSVRNEPTNLHAFKNIRGTDIIEGFEPGEEFKFKIWDNVTEVEIETFNVEYEAGEEFWQWRGNSIISIMAESPKILELELDSGWNMISINVVPPDEYWLIGENGEHIFDGPDAVLMTEQFRYIDENNEAQHHVRILKDSNGLFYMPEFEFNNIPFWNLEFGFLMCVDSALTSTWSGDLIPPDSPITLHSGWNLIAYYPEYNLEASAPDYYVLSQIIDNVRIAKDDDGLFLSTVNDFSNMPPWKEKTGYLVLIESDEPIILTYPPEREMIALSHPNNRLGEFNGEGFQVGGNLHKSDRNMSVLVNTVSNQDIQQSDKILAYNLSGDLLVGTGNIDANGRCGLAVWGDDSATKEIDGLLEGEEFILEIQQLDDSFLNRETLIISNAEENEPQVPVEQSLTYRVNDIVVIDLELASTVPVDYYMAPNYPNPFNSNTSIRYGLPHSGVVQFDIYDVAGRHIESLLQEKQQAGHHSIVWDGSGRSSGLYIFQMNTESFKSVRKVILVK
ncbi:MAG: T9SS type A sorting domain-containing protein [Calditrichaeota bacterium]|nr:T9SS type A sorting domain-containing protein [Calditrichota bacterium]